MNSQINSVVIVGASLAGLRAAEALRDEGFAGTITLIGDELHYPYDRPPLSKQVALGWCKASKTGLVRAREIDADWRLGVKAISIERESRLVHLDTGNGAIQYDRLLIATGTRARPWVDAKAAAFEGVLTLRTADDAEALRKALEAKPRRVVIIGGGFTGSELASVCRELNLPTTLIERSSAPLGGALGEVIGAIAADLQQSHGVDLRCNQGVKQIEGNEKNKVCRVHLEKTEEPIDCDLVVVALGSIPNNEWLKGSGLAFGPHGVACDAACRVFDEFGIATDDIFAAGDIARFPHPLFNYEFVTLEHWGNAVSQAQVASHNMLHSGLKRRAYLKIPSFWSSQFGTSIKSVGIPPSADEICFAQGSPESKSFVAVYGRDKRIVAAVAFNENKWLEYYERLIAEGAPFPTVSGINHSSTSNVMPCKFPHSASHGLNSYITLSGQSPVSHQTIFHPGK